MSKYSETIGSFLRTGNYPLEANYIFDSEEELVQFFENTTNKETLHKGLLKIVDENGEQFLYWVIENEGELKFSKLISSSTLELLNTLKENLEKEITDREEADSTLRETITRFLTTVDELDSKINTLPELQNFLEGYSDTDKLQTILQNLASEIKGNPLKVQTLADLETALLALTQVTKNRADNLQSELDQTQIGVGLSGDGSYNADQETHYLKNATSVMNALKILDGLIRRLNYEFEDTDSIELLPTTDEDTNVTTLRANVKIAEDSDIEIQKDGLQYKLETEYLDGVLTIKVNGEVRSTHNIGLSAIVDDAFYDVQNEKIVIIFKLPNDEVQRVEIPADKIITEWDVDNSGTVELTRTRVINGPDTLSANVKAATSKSLGGVICKGTSEYIGGPTALFPHVRNSGEIYIPVFANNNTLNTSYSQYPPSLGLSASSGISLQTTSFNVSNQDTPREGAYNLATEGLTYNVQKELQAEIDTIKTETVNTTYAELKQLVADNGLKPGNIYRITDYEFTTTQEATKSAEHPFDILLTAETTNTFLTKARALPREGDTYYQHVDLTKWEVEYTFDNNKAVHIWADEENGKGVITYLKDDKGNEAYYDFKNALFERRWVDFKEEYFKLTGCHNGWDEAAGHSRINDETVNVNFWEYTSNRYHRWIVPTGATFFGTQNWQVGTINEEKGVQWCFTFSNHEVKDVDHTNKVITFGPPFTDGSIISEDDTLSPLYTGEEYDGPSHWVVKNNVIKPYKDGTGAIHLPDIVVFGSAQRINKGRCCQNNYFEQTRHLTIRAYGSHDCSFVKIDDAILGWYLLENFRTAPATANTDLGRTYHIVATEIGGSMDYVSTVCFGSVFTGTLNGWLRQSTFVDEVQGLDCNCSMYGIYMEKPIRNVQFGPDGWSTGWRSNGQANTNPVWCDQAIENCIIRGKGEGNLTKLRSSETLKNMDITIKGNPCNVPVNPWPNSRYKWELDITGSTINKDFSIDRFIDERATPIDITYINDIEL